MANPKISVIIGSVRPNRFADKPATWIFEELKKKGVDAELLDLKDYPLPFYDEPMGPSMLNGKYSNEVATKWAAKIAAADGYVIVSPEYNHSTSGVLKNAMDWLFPEWNLKPVGFVSYGGVGGARAIEHLRQIAVELSMAPIRNAVHIPGNVVFSGEPWTADTGAKLKDKSDAMIEQLLWWARALKEAREKRV